MISWTGKNKIKPHTTPHPHTPMKQHTKTIPKALSPIQILTFVYQELTLLMCLFLFGTLISSLVLSSSIKFLNAFALLQVICQCLINNFSLESVYLFLSNSFSSDYLAHLWESCFFSGQGDLGVHSRAVRIIANTLLLWVSKLVTHFLRVFKKPVRFLHEPVVSTFKNYHFFPFLFTHCVQIYF